MFQIDKTFSGANISRTIRFTDAMYQRLNEISAREQISFNSLVLQCCVYALSQLDLQQEDK